MIKNKEAAPEYMKSETVVWWDINRCPIPEGYDAFRVGPRIDTMLMSLGYSGPLTINAIGDMEDSPTHEVLRALSSSGILIKDVACGLNMLQSMMKWEAKNPPPATVMVISDYRGLDDLEYPLCQIYALGYNILVAFQHTRPQPRFKHLVASVEWLWEAFLTDAVDSQETRRPEKNCSEDAFICQSCTCDFASQSFKMFIKHLMSREHMATTFKTYPKEVVKPPPKMKKPCKKKDLKDRSSYALPMFDLDPIRVVVPAEFFENDEDRVKKYGPPPTPLDNMYFPPPPPR